ncbi:MFS transporter [Legionella maioricensis]|uniref:MFS transporter n=1 Tax=Legionella maioricensis TaxID=2896528 RepID=A0A9X2IDD6_9GAMM|nr:MFS transporter [Legionella maioricensis]MCL9684653.1 MFS transporter [Legionella maioricensis]MCL9687433.1 MFS transporter [Legionella maioricensis]
MERIYGYIVWFTATLFVVYAFCLNTASAVFSDAIKTTLGASPVGVSIAMSAFILSFACMQIPAGYLLDKFNPRLVVSGGILLLATGNVLTSYSDNITLFTISNVIQGCGASFAFVAAAVLIPQWFSEKQFPILFGLTQTMSCILSGIIHYYFTVELKIHTWNDIYRGLALFGFILFLLSALSIKSPPHYRRGENISLKNSLTLVFKNKQIILCSLAAATSFGVLLAYAGTWYIKIQTYYSVDNLQAVIIGGMIFLGIGIGTPFLGWLSNKVKSRVMVIHVTLCLGTMFLLMGISLPHFDFRGLILAQIISFLIGFFLSGSMLFYSVVSELSTNATRGVAISVLNTAVFLFNTLMMFIPYAFLTSTSTEFFTYLWTLPFFILISILLLYFIKDSFSSK